MERVVQIKKVNSRSCVNTIDDITKTNSDCKHSKNTNKDV